MVSNLYTAKNYYSLQEKGKIGKGLSKSNKLQKDNKGFYLIKQNSKGSPYKQRVDKNDRVYSRQEGTTLYSKSKDSEIKSSYVKHTPKEHYSNAHKHDKRSSKRRFNV